MTLGLLLPLVGFEALCVKIELEPRLPNTFGLLQQVRLEDLCLFVLSHDWYVSKENLARAIDKVLPASATPVTIPTWGLQIA